jgi:hypothetical protein
MVVKKAAGTVPIQGLAQALHNLPVVANAVEKQAVDLDILH